MRKTEWAFALFALAITGAWAQITPQQLWVQKTVPQPDKDGVYPLGNGVVAPSLIHAVPAVYPANPDLVGLKRVCMLDVVVEADGTSARINVLGNSCSSPFDEAAINAVRHSQFEPGKLNGNLVPVRIPVCVSFLGGEEPAIPKQFPLAGFKYPVPLSQVEAEYSHEARSAKLEGFVLVSVLITEDGLSTNAQVIRPLGEGLDEKALQAVSKWRFRPAVMDGIPAPCHITVMVDFRLHH